MSTLDLELLTLRVLALIFLFAWWGGWLLDLCQRLWDMAVQHPVLCDTYTHGLTGPGLCSRLEHITTLSSA